MQVFKLQPHKMIKKTQAIRRQQPTNYLNVFDPSIGLAPKGLLIKKEKNNSRLIKLSLLSL